jgi:hypothetical protein
MEVNWFLVSPSGEVLEESTEILDLIERKNDVEEDTRITDERP